jgi:hypothetical protein
VLAAARFPLALDLGQAPADAQPEHEPPLRELVDVGERVREHGRVAQRRQAGSRCPAGALRDGGEVGQRRERLERGFATTLSPTHKSMPASSDKRATAQHSSTGGRRAIAAPRAVGKETPSRIDCEKRDW